MLKGPHFFERGRNSKMMRTHGFCVAEPLEFKIKLVQIMFRQSKILIVTERLVFLNGRIIITFSS